MKNSILGIGMAAAGMLAFPALSQAADGNGGFFINGSVGQASLNEGIYDDSDTGYQFSGGYRWALSPGFAFGIEGGYADLGEFGPDSDLVIVTPGPTPENAEVSGWTLGVNSMWGLGESWYLSGRVGLFSADVKGSLLVAGVPIQFDGSSDDWYAGLGTGYNFSENFGLGVSYDWYNAGEDDLNLNSGMFSVTGEVRF